MKQIRWGVVGTGYIAGNLAECMDFVPEAQKTAVTGTSMEKARAFAEKHGFEAGFDSLEDMLAQAKPDVVYIAVPNHLHFGLVMQALEAGVNVLCEKPMADNMLQLGQMIDKAREKDVFLMEGMWTRCFPAVRRAVSWIESGAIGQVVSVRADFGLKSAPGWQSWKASAAASGGALRDVGVYSVAMAFLGFQKPPESIVSTCILKDGADAHSEIMFRYGGSRAAYLTGSFEVITDHRATIYGDKGAIVLGEKLWCPNRAPLYSYDGDDIFTKVLRETFEDDYKSHGFQYEVAHVCECLAEGRKESPYFPLGESAEIMKVTDSLRKEWGVRYASAR